MRKNQLIMWLKVHKKELLLVGVSITSVIAIILAIQNQEAIEELWLSLTKKVELSPELAVDSITNSAPMIPPNDIPVKTIESISDSIPVFLSNDPHIPFEVSRHIRNLPEGWNPSPEKIAAALKNNILLQEGQTWVEAYLK